MKLTRKILIKSSNTNEEGFKFLLKQLCIKDRSQQLRFFLEYLNKNFDIQVLFKFIPFLIKRLKRGFFTFRGKKYKVEEFCRELNFFKENLIFKYRKVKRYKVKDNKCPKCFSKLIVGQPQCKKCKIYLKW